MWCPVILRAVSAYIFVNCINNTILSYAIQNIAANWPLLMTFQIQPEVPLLLIIFFITVSLLLYSVHQYQRQGYQQELIAFISLLVVISIWQFNAIFIEVITIPALILIGNNFGNAILVPGLIYSFTWFVLSYSNNTQWVNKLTGGFALGIMGMLTLILVSNPEFFYTTNGLTTQGPFTIVGITFPEWVTLDLTLKPTFRFFQVGFFLSIIAASSILVRYLFQNSGTVYTGQVAALTTGIGTPILVNSLLFIGIIPPEWNLTHISFGITAVAFAIAIFRYRLLELAPVGRKELVEQLTDPIIMLDGERQVVDCNAAARQLVEAPSGWRGMSAATFFSPFSEPVEWFIADNPGETKLQDGTVHRIFSVSSVPIRPENPTRSGQVIRLKEITEQKHRETQLLHQNRQLDQFTTIISDDIQNPLNVAKGRIKIAERNRNSNQLAEIDDALSRIESLVDTISTMARTGQAIDTTEPLGLKQIAQTAWTYSDIDYCELDIEIPSDTKIVSNRNRLLQLFENIYVNSGEHNESSVTVTVGLLDVHKETNERKTPGGFYIEDNGQGISDEVKKRVFESGFTSVSNNEGFGLAIVHDIVEVHRWEIDVVDSTSGGARFEISGVSFHSEARSVS